MAQLGKPIRSCGERAREGGGERERVRESESESESESYCSTPMESFTFQTSNAYKAYQAIFAAQTKAVMDCADTKYRIVFASIFIHNSFTDRKEELCIGLLMKASMCLQRTAAGAC